MNKLAYLITVALLSCTAQKKQQQSISETDIERIIKTLSADDMKGRAAFTEGAEKAAAFIESEFKEIGLQPIQGQSGYRQNFMATRISPASAEVTIDGRRIGADSIVALTDRASLEWNGNAEVIYIQAGENIFTRYGEIAKSNKQVLVLAHPSFANDFGRLKSYLEHGRIVEKNNEELAAVFVLADIQPQTYQVRVENKVERLPLFNVAGIIPGKSKSAEFVIFSGHYDHIGILPAVNGDSIANGADDDASGVTAVLTLAKYFKRLGNNERTLVFVAFAAEELGMVGSKYFSKQMNADAVTAMFNIEMIGKQSKFGKNTAFITGYERSDFGKILQKNLEGTAFTFHPDPYKEQNLFYRSDNATLAALGVPAHTISTCQIDIDKFYHTVDDELESLNVENIKSTIQAIALSAKGIVAGNDTPTRVSKVSE